MPSISQRMAHLDGRAAPARRPSVTAAAGPTTSNQPFVPTANSASYGGFLDAQAHKPGGTARRNSMQRVPPPPPPPPPLPPAAAWRRHVDGASGRPYWHDTVSGATTWDDPTPPPPAEPEEPLARTRRRPSNPFQTAPPRPRPLVPSSSSDSGADAPPADLAARVAALEKTVAALVRRLART